MSSITSVAAGGAEALRGTKEKIDAVLQLVRKGDDLTKKQLEYCDEACVGRCLKARGYHVRKAAKLLKSLLTWRENFDVDYLIADEFSAELASGAAYVAGHDNEGRPVVIIRKKNYNHNSWSQKQYLRYLIFTMEVAVASMSPGVDQWILIIDVGNSKSNSPSSSTILGTLKILNENYPERLARAFIVDAPSVFYYLWKGMGLFVDQSTKGKVNFVSSKDHVFQDAVVTTSSRNPPQENEKRPSLRRLLQESPSYKSIRPERSLACSPRQSVNESSLVNNLHTRSFSFSTPTTACNSPVVQGKEFSSFRAERSFWVPGLISGNQGRKVKAGESSSFRLGKKSEQNLASVEHRERTSNWFRPYWKFYRAPYNETAYRATMKLPLSGLKSIICYSLKNHLS